MARLSEQHDLNPIFEAVELWKEKALIKDQSVFCDQSIWTVENIDDFHKHFVENPQTGSETFYEKLKIQLTPASSEVRKLASEMLWVMFLFPSNINYETKLKGVSDVWAWSGGNLDANQPLLKGALAEGVGHCGPGYNNLRWAELAFFINLAKHWKLLDLAQRVKLLSDPWNLGKFVDTVKDSDKRQLRHILLYLLAPDYYERISTGNHKRRIIAAFEDVAEQPDESVNAVDSKWLIIDKKLYTIRAALATKLGDEHLDFYWSPLKERWLGEASPRTWIFQANPEFYDVRRAVNELKEDTWLVLQHKEEIHTGDRAYLWTSGPDAGIVAVAEIIDEVSERPMAEQSQRYVKEPSKFLGLQPRVSMRILKTVDPTLTRKGLLTYQELKNLSILKQAQGTNFPVTASESQFIDRLIASRSSTASTEQVIQWIRNIRTQAGADGRFVHKPLVILALLSLMDKEQDHGESFSYDELFSEYRRLASEFTLLITEDQFSQPYMRLRNDTQPLRVLLPVGNEEEFDDGKADEPTYVRSICPHIKIAGAVWPAFESIEQREKIRKEVLSRWPMERPYEVDEAIKDLFIRKEQFEEMLALFRAKRNLILQGPPGVGKSFFAKRLAYALIRSEAKQRVKMIQFHQSYTYEEFIQGYRPTQDGSFSLKKGVFYNFCIEADKDRDHDYVFIIDEINRGNLSKIFGEVMLLIEFDKRSIEWALPLTYSTDTEPKFFVPENVFLLGLMNTADRSIAMVDYALRRRFAFVNLEPAFEDSEFENYLKRYGAGESLIQLIKSRMTELNKMIREDKDLGPGFCIGHSFFCSFKKGNSLNDEWYRRVILNEIAPLIREYWFDKPKDDLDAKIDRLLRPL